MKRFLLVMLALLLAGCSSRAENSAPAETAAAVAETVISTEAVLQTEATVPQTEPVPQAVPTAPAYAVTTIICSDGRKTVNTLDERGNPVKSVRTDGGKDWEYEYTPDEWGYLFSSVDFEKKVIRTDAAGRPVITESYVPGESGEMELTSTVEHTFHKNGRMASVKTIHAKSGTSYYEADEYGRATLYRYTKDGKVTDEYTVTYDGSPDSGSATATYKEGDMTIIYTVTYDENGKPVRCEGEGKVWEYTYEKIENPTFLVSDWDIWRVGRM